jgi:hypothetical protein
MQEKGYILGYTTNCILLNFNDLNAYLLNMLKTVRNSLNVVPFLFYFTS